MTTFKQYISERKQVGKLYHFTSVAGALGILETQQLKASKGVDYVSFTRNHRFAKDLNKSQYSFRFTIDGDKLSDKYKIEPYHDSTYYNKHKSKQHEDEMEEAIFLSKNGNKPVSLKGAIIDVTIDKSKYDTYNTDQQFLDFINRNIKQYNIKIGDINSKI